MVDGNDSGRTVAICADLNCEIHHAQSRRDRDARERMRSEQRRQEERKKQELATRARMLAAILDKVTAPLSTADLELIVREFSRLLPNEYRTALAQRHGDPPKPSGKGSMRETLDETGYSRLLIELSLFDSVHNPYSRDGAAKLEAVVKRYRVNSQKIAASVAAEFAAKRKRQAERAKAKVNRKRGNGQTTAPKSSGK